MSATDCEEYARNQDPATLAARLRRDQELCKAGLRPSPLALFLPPNTSPLADAIAKHLGGNGAKVPRSVRRLWYDGIVQGVKNHIARMDTWSTQAKHEFDQSLHVTSSEINTALKVLYMLSDPDRPNCPLTFSMPLEEVIGALMDEDHVQHILKGPRSLHEYKKQKRKCYICRFYISNPHILYPALCEPCGSFNFAESSLSLPNNLSLHNKMALITGGRVNLGFHCALRLLRCGARTIVSTRYPLDSEMRYRAEHDFNDWADRLRIVGADFRTAKDAFGLVSAVKSIVREWNEADGATGEGSLHVLINNAAQTLTDSPGNETKASEREEDLRERLGSSRLQVGYEGGYRARIWGGGLRPMLEPDTQEVEQKHENRSVSLAGAQTKSSWVQTLPEIPYEDMIAAHSVNSFVPLILCRELLPLMGSTARSSQGSHEEASHEQLPHHIPRASGGASRPLGYIVNVSSREGIFESRPENYSKAGFHVHTNMSKAALNMLTETESTPAWKTRRVAMNTVDPGYMSAAPEFQGEGRYPCPIGFEDGAARVLWPVAVGETRGTAIRGRFLKHFGKDEVEVGLGR
jgi:NAD(P)-dependent dehydrogenase (short-subunit alcohol dehydrogenase family)